jgi:uncharacterized glyoxalase superfamily protein PhnB
VATSRFVPDGWPRLVPRVFVGDHAGLVAFVKDVFGAEGELHAERPTELRIGDSMLMVSDATVRETQTACLYVYVEDADAVHRRAVQAGGRSLEEPIDTPYGDRRAIVRDVWGNTWQIATHGGRFTP